MLDITRSIRQRRDQYVARRNPFAARWTTLRGPAAADVAVPQPERADVDTEHGSTPQRVTRRPQSP